MNAKRGKRREAARSIAKQSVAQRTHAPHTRHTPVHNTCARVTCVVRSRGVSVSSPVLLSRPVLWHCLWCLPCAVRMSPSFSLWHLCYSTFDCVSPAPLSAFPGTRSTRTVCSRRTSSTRRGSTRRLGPMTRWDSWHDYDDDFEPVGYVPIVALCTSRPGPLWWTISLTGTSSLLRVSHHACVP